MINVHQRLSDAFATLPAIGVTDTFEGFKPNYKWGDEFELNKLIKLYNNEETNPYPLIYNISNTYKHNFLTKEVECNLQLVLATREKNTSYTNTQRWAMSYANILFPLAANIETLFRRNLIFKWDNEFTLLEFPNYGDGKANETTDIWDALRFDVTITINDKCLNKIFY